MLEILTFHLNLACPLYICIFTFALVTFWTQCCLGEMLSHTQTSFKSPHKVPCLTDLFAPLTYSGLCKLFLPKIKAMGFKGAHTFITAQYGNTNPIPALTITSLSTPHLLTIHFSHIVLAEDTSHKFFAQCNKIWSIYRPPTSTGHCFCIRSTTELLLWGVPPDIVKMLGCWKSDIVLPQLSSAFFSAFLWLFHYRECGN
jgi:hypothetical protein